MSGELCRKAEDERWGNLKMGMEESFGGVGGCGCRGARCALNEGLLAGSCLNLAPGATIKIRVRARLPIDVRQATGEGADR